MRWLTAPIDPEVGARWQRMACVVTAIYVIVRAVPLTRPGNTDSFSGIGALTPLSEPLPTTALIALVVVSVGALGLAAIRPENAEAVAVGALGTLALTTHRSSFGQILWFDILMVLHLLVIAAAALLNRRQQGASQQALVMGWGVRLCAIATVTTYFVSGVTKLRIGGLSWVSSEALERHIGFTAARAEALGGRVSPVAESVIELGLASRPAAALALALELGAPLALLHRRVAMTWSALIWLMHVVIAATMFIVFHWPLLGLAMAPVLWSCRGARPTTADA